MTPRACLQSRPISLHQRAGGEKTGRELFQNVSVLTDGGSRDGRIAADCLAYNSRSRAKRSYECCFAHDHGPALRPFSFSLFPDCGGWTPERVGRASPLFPSTQECGRCPMGVHERRARSRTTGSTLVWGIPDETDPAQASRWI